jgi:NADH-quinone oxidoreductase subunit K
MNLIDISFIVFLFLMCLISCIFFEQHLLIILIYLELLTLIIFYTFVIFSKFLLFVNGLIYALIILTLAAAETAIGLIILLIIFQIKKSLSLFLHISSRF